MRGRQSKLQYRSRVSLRSTRATALHRLEAEQIEEARQVVDLAPARRRGAADEVEDLAVLDAVIGEPLDAAVLVEIDRDHALIDRLLPHEGDRPLGALGDIVEGLAADGCHGRWRAKQDQHLLLAGADRDLLERAFRNDVALLVSLAEAARERQAEREHRCERRAEAEPAEPIHSLAHSHIPLRPSIV